MDMVSFGEACEGVRRARRAAVLETAFAVRVAHHADGKAWEQWRKDMSDADPEETRKDAAAFLARFGAGIK
jgi:hypothetical protein